MLRSKLSQASGASTNGSYAARDKEINYDRLNLSPVTTQPNSSVAPAPREFIPINSAGSAYDVSRSTSKLPKGQGIDLLGGVRASLPQLTTSNPHMSKSSQRASRDVMK